MSPQLLPEAWKKTARWVGTGACFVLVKLVCDMVRTSAQQGSGIGRAVVFLCTAVTVTFFFWVQQHERREQSTVDREK
jgi:hypothetical protein